MTIHMYAQHTGRAGQVCTDEGAIERGSDDVFALTGSPAELLDYAMQCAARSSAYGSTCAQSILRALDDAPQAMQARLRDLGASEDELKWAWGAEEYDLLRTARGDWGNLLPAIRQEMAAEDGWLA